MAGIQRFVSYMNLYDTSETFRRETFRRETFRHEKLCSAGFAKVEIRGEQCRIEIHVKNAGTIRANSPIYLFSREADIIHAVEIGSINISGGGGDYKAILKSEGISHSPYSIKDMSGILILVNDQYMFASQWGEGEIVRGHIRIWEQNLELEKQEMKDEPEVVRETEKLTEQETSNEPVTIKATEMPMRQPQREMQRPQETLGESFERIQKKKEDVEIFEIDGAQIRGVHIELRDIRELPKRYWYMGNNSFLLHGFFNYRYLLLGKKISKEDENGEKKEKIFIGVPGVCVGQERVMAALFGFPEFVPENGSGTENFGYWCHAMSE